MCLDEQVSLDMGVIVLSLGELERYSSPQLSEEGVLLVTDRQTFIFGSRGEDFQEPPQLGLVVKRPTEHLWEKKGVW